MAGNLTDSILAVCKALNKFSVEYIIVGGTAVALHGYFRRSTNAAGNLIDKPDLDFWYNPTYDNYFKLLNTLEELGQDVTNFKQDRRQILKNHFSSMNLKISLLIFYRN
jgi:hypothetical protein